MAWDTLKTALVVAGTVPIFVVVYPAAFLSRLSGEERRLLREARKSPQNRGATFAAIAVGAIAISARPALPVSPLWAELLSRAASWTLLALAFAHRSLGLRKRNYELWLESLKGKPVDMPRAVVHMFAALIPGVIIQMILSSP